MAYIVTPFFWKKVGGLGAVVFVAFCLRFFSWWMEPTISRDGVKYIGFVQSWRQFSAFDDFFAANPLFNIPPFFIYLTEFISRNAGVSPEYAALALNIVLGALLVLIAFDLLKEAGASAVICWCAAILTAVHPVLISYSIQVQRENLYLFFCSLFGSCAIRALKRNSPVWWIGAGVFSSGAFLTRYEGGELFLLGSILPFWSGWCQRKWQKAMVGISLFFLSSMVCFLMLTWLLQVPLDFYFGPFLSKIFSFAKRFG